MAIIMTPALVTIKKADGTIEKITLDELKKRQSAKSAPVVPPPVSKPAPAPAPVSVKIAPPTPPSPPQTTPKPITPAPTPTANVDRVKEMRIRSERKEDLSVQAHKDDFLMDDMLPMKPGESEPVVYKESPLPVAATPFNSFVAPEKKPIVNKPISAPPVNKPTFTPPISKPISAPPVNKQVMSDVVETRPAVMSPLEEIRYFTLTDFRRLSSDPIEAASRLKQKFVNLKEESVTFYFDAIAAWQKSPLYLDYMRAVAKALSNKIPLAQALETAPAIQIAEITALVEMEATL